MFSSHLLSTDSLIIYFIGKKREEIDVLIRKE